MFEMKFLIAALFAASAVLYADADETLRPITSYAESLALSDAEFGEGRPFEITGQVIAVYPNRTVFFHDASGFFEILFDEAHGLKVGDVVSVRGHTKFRQKTSGVRDLIGDSWAIKGTAQIPQPERTTIASLVDNIRSTRFVEVHGTITDAFVDEIDSEWNYFILKDGASVIHVAIADSGDMRKRLADFVDAEVDVTGAAFSGHAGFRRFIGPFLHVWEESCIRIVKPAPKDPFSLPELEDLSDIGAEKVSAMARRTATGTVLAVWGKGNVLVQDRLGRMIRVDLANPAILPSCGDRIAVVGYPESDMYRINLARAQFRKEGGVTKLTNEAESVTPESILLDDHGRQMIKPNYHGRLVRMTGLVRALPAEAGDERVFYIDCGKFLIPADVSAKPEIASELEIGCRVEVTGVCVLESPNWRPSMAFPRIERLLLVPCAKEDIRIISRPPWLTTGRLLAFIGALLAALAAILVWNLSLRRLAERRGRELLRSELSQAEAELRVDERTRLAAELHDSLAQNMTGISFQIAAARSARNVSPEAESKHLETAERMLLSSRTELRRCIWDLRSEALSEPDFAKAIHTTVQPVIGKAKLDLSCDIDRSLMDDSTAHAVLRILRELAANAVAHGKAANVMVVCEDKGSELRFTVSDDGCGFNPSTCPGQNEGHFGLSGIRERVKRLEGAFEIKSATGKGTVATVTLAKESTPL